MARREQDLITAQFNLSAGLIDAMARDEKLVQSLDQVAQVWTVAIRNGGKIMLAGNGGSAADAQHVAGELINRMNFDRPAMAGLALSTDSSVLTCIGNDSSFDDIFARQIDALGHAEDVFCAISTSGNSRNIIRAIEAAKNKGIPVVGFTGQSGGAMKDMCDFIISIPHDVTPRIQEGHLCCYHAICTIVETNIYGADNSAS